MNEAALTLRDLLLPSQSNLTEAAQADFEASQPARELKEELAKHKALGWPGTLSLVVGKIGDLLDVPIAENIFIKVWNEAQLFRRYLDRDRYPANETIAVPMAKHTIKSTHRPYLEVRVNESVVQRIEFDVSLEITLKGAILEIQDARIRKLRTGECTGKVELRCERLLLASEKFETKRLPGVIPFKDGIPIAP